LVTSITADEAAEDEAEELAAAELETGAEEATSEDSATLEDEVSGADEATSEEVATAEEETAWLATDWEPVAPQLAIVAKKARLKITALCFFMCSLSMKNKLNL
jgi:hypothetical protein